jgi:hypothetical protein
MVGVVVVGSGAGGVIETATGDGPVVKVDPADLQLRSASTLPAATSDDTVAWTVAASAVALLGVAAALVVGRRRRVARTNAAAGP